MGKRRRPGAATVNVGGEFGSTAQRGPSVLRAAESCSLDEAGFDAFVEEQCAKFYADGVGWPSLPPGRYFPMLLLDYFEGLDSERAIARWAADSLSLRQFLDVALHEAPPDHSTMSRTR